MANGGNKRNAFADCTGLDARSLDGMSAFDLVLTQLRQQRHVPAKTWKVFGHLAGRDKPRQAPCVGRLINAGARA